MAIRVRQRWGITGLCLAVVLVAAALASPAYADKPGPGATLATKTNAYGRYCQNQSTVHVGGQKGTPFSQCVTAMAKLAVHQSKDPWTACSALSRKPVPGASGSPFSRCVVAGTRLLKDLKKP